MTDKKTPTEREIMEAMLAYTRSAAELAGHMQDRAERFRGDWDQIRHDLNNAAVTVEGLLLEMEEGDAE